ncbi:hypothetical protein QQF64_032717 [Cirrhinus molitorella]|uniref:Uncharacterized protein n=1 Tax=Cirrhinus molitorella TaxID=172907 RepID=A0ABR3MRU5_9TELE
MSTKPSVMLPDVHASPGLCLTAVRSCMNDTPEPESSADVSDPHPYRKKHCGHPDKFKFIFRNTWQILFSSIHGL